VQGHSSIAATAPSKRCVSSERVGRAIARPDTTFLSGRSGELLRAWRIASSAAACCSCRVPDGVIPPQSVSAGCQQPRSQHVSACQHGRRPILAWTRRLSALIASRPVVDHARQAGGHWFEPSTAHSDPRSCARCRMAVRVIHDIEVRFARVVRSSVRSSSFGGATAPCVRRGGPCPISVGRCAWRASSPCRQLGPSRPVDLGVLYSSGYRPEERPEFEAFVTPRCGVGKTTWAGPKTLGRQSYD
jgi:hypothetical protein